MTVYVSGTFNHLHDGHLALLQRAVDLACKNKANLWIGIMSDEFLKNKYPRAKPENLQLYINREKAIIDWLNLDDPWVWRKGRVSFEYVHDPDQFPEISSDEDILVVSEESAGRGAGLIAEHNSRMLMSVVPVVRDKNGHKISSCDMLPIEEQFATFKEELMWFGDEQWYDGGMYCYHYKGKCYSFDEYEDVKEEDGKPL